VRAAGAWWRLLAAALSLALAGCQGPERVRPSVGLALGSTLRVLHGNFRFGRGEDTAASLAYLRALESADAERWRPWVSYDLGTQYVALGELQAGLRRLAEADRGERPPRPARSGRELAFRLAFNLGVARYEGGEFEEAAWSFIEALRHRPDNWDAKHNLELSVRSSLGGAARGADARSPRSDPRGEEQARRQLQRLHEQEEPSWMSAPSAEAYAQDW